MFFCGSLLFDVISNNRSEVYFILRRSILRKLNSTGIWTCDVFIGKFNSTCDVHAVGTTVGTDAIYCNLSYFFKYIYLYAH